MNSLEDLMIEIPLHFEPKTYTNIFKNKNNSTLKETIESPRYEFLSSMVIQHYYHHLDAKIGDFLIALKESGDNFYKEFLNKYGDLEYSTFYLHNKEQHDLRGVYFYYLDNELKYIGRCRDNIKKRVNAGYGKISPKKCFKDGQSTNCKVNSLITKNQSSIMLKLISLDDVREIEELESRLILECEPEWNSKK